MIFMEILFGRELFDGVRNVREQCEVTRPLDCLHELALMLRTSAGDPFWDYFTLL